LSCAKRQPWLAPIVPSYSLIPIGAPNVAPAVTLPQIRSLTEDIGTDTQVCRTVPYC
jgi:hypothetical protein